MSDPTSSAAEIIEDLARRTQAADSPEPYDLNRATSIVSRVMRNDESLHARNFEGWLGEPNRPRGEALLYDARDFAHYVARLADEWTTVWADEASSRVTAVFNDHLNNADAGWRDHTATLQLKNDPEWTAFIARDGKYYSQLEFAEFLQDYAPSFIQPSGAELLEIAIDFKAHRKAEYASAVDLDNGDVQLTYTEITTAKTQKAGQIDIPKELTVGLSPFLGMDPVPMLARLRWNLDGGHLQIGFKLQRPDLVRREAFAHIREGIADDLKDTARGGTLPVLLGHPPAAVVPQS